MPGVCPDGQAPSCLAGGQGESQEGKGHDNDRVSAHLGLGRSYVCSRALAWPQLPPCLASTQVPGPQEAQGEGGRQPPVTRVALEEGCGLWLGTWVWL